ncbi:MAG: DUF4091 domain-containing protein [Victivallales bacterium]|nr:DUF4091 domain-containing protein [Victivallales bacterium]
MRRVFWMLLVLGLGCLGAEISGNGYRVAMDSQGMRIYHRGQLLQATAYPSVVEGPKWKRVLLSDKNWRTAKQAVENGELRSEFTGEDAKAVLTAKIAGDGVDISMQFDSEVQPLTVAELWFGSLPLERFADCKYTLRGKKDVYTLPTTKEKEPEQKSKWRISPDVKGVSIETATGTLEVTSDTYFSLFDARFHLSVPVFARTIGFRSMGKMVSGETYTFHLKFTENETAKKGNTDYQVKADQEGMSITWRGHEIQTTAWPSVVEGPQWKKSRMDNGFFWKNASITTEGTLTTVKSVANDVTSILTAEIQADGVELTYQYDTQVEPIFVADFWFASLPLADFAGRTYRSGEKPDVLTLPPSLERESVPKSRWDLWPNTRRLEIDADYGTLVITGETPFHLFDARYHGYFPVRAHTIVVRSEKGMQKARVYRYKLQVKETKKDITPEASNEKQPLLLRPMKQAPAIDGKLAQNEWADAAEYSLHKLALRKDITANTTVWAGYDNENLYFAYRCEDPRGRELLKQPQQRHVYGNDCIEILLNTDGEVAYKQVQADVLGRLDVNHQGAKAIYELKNERVKHQVTVDDTGWNIEIAIPMKDLGITPDTDWPMFANISRSRHFGFDHDSKSEHSTLAPLQSAFQELHRLLPLRFAGRKNGIPFADKKREIPVAAGDGWVVASFASQEAADVLPKILCGQEKKLRAVNAQPLALSPARPSVATFHFDVTKDDELFYVQCYDKSGTYLLASRGPFFFAQKSLGSELVRFQNDIPNLAKTFQVTDGLTALSAEIQEIAKKYAANHDEAITAQAEDLANTRNRLRILAAQKKAGMFQKHLAYYLCSPMMKVRRVLPVADSVKLGGTLELEGAGDEVVNGQVVLLPLDRSLGTMEASASDLRTADGKVIPASQISLYFVEDVSLYTVMWPDRLNRKPTALPRAANQQPAWVVVKIPKGTPAGTYQGALTYRAPEGSTEVPVTLRTYGFDLPHIRKPVAWADVTPEFFKKPEHSRAFRKELISRDIFPGAPAANHPRWLDTADFLLDDINYDALAKFDLIVPAMFPWVEWLERFYKNGKYPTPSAYYDHVCEIVKSQLPEIQKRGGKNVTYFYYDEINLEQKLVYDMFMKLKKETGVKVITCFCTPSLGTSKVDYYRDMVDFYVFSGNHFTDPMWIDYIDKLQKKGNKIGWYFNMAYPKMPTSNVIDCPGAVNRIQLFFQWKYHVDMSLYWCAHHWNSDTYKNPVLHKSRGNGMFFYPDQEDGFTPSIRSELLRDGIQDYRYLHFLDTLFREKGAKADAKLASEVKDILAVTWAKSITDYPEDPETIEAQHRRMVAAIAKLRAL